VTSEDQARIDAAPVDAGPVDAGPVDAGPVDAGPLDAGPVDVLVIGGGPAGASVGCRLAAAGHRVMVVERRAMPRVKTCGDLLSPRAVRALDELGIGDADLQGFHRVDRVRLTGPSGNAEVAWPAHSRYPDHGYVARRDRLDAVVAERATAAGALVLGGHEALSPIVERGFVRGAVVADPSGRRSPVRARFLVIADGANSRFGRSLGTFRERSWPYATAIRNYWSSPLHDTDVIEVVMGLTDRDGDPVSGYGWVFPLGDGTVNVGVGVISTATEFRQLNTSHLLDLFVRRVADRWQFDPSEPHGTAASGRVPLGNSVRPVAGPTYVVVGDAAGSANPLTGAGIEYALEGGRMAADVLDEALRERNATALQRYPKLLDEEYGTYFQVGRLLDRLAARPAVVRRAARVAARHPKIAGGILRFGVNELRGGPARGAELAYALASAVTKVAPRA
jgi:geranylgeranyl reductase family protein